MSRRLTSVAASAAEGLFVTAGFAGPASAETDRGIGAHQLLGSRYETMLALARALDRLAQGALQAAGENAHSAARGSRGSRAEIGSFAGSTSNLHRTMRERQVTSIDLPVQLADLAQRARLLNGRMRTNALPSHSETWDAVTDVLERMTRLLAGQDVEVPFAYFQGALPVVRVVELRQLASDVAASAARALGGATRAANAYRERGQQFLGELRHFSGQSRDLRTQANTGRLDPRTIGPLVDYLLDEARQANRRMRESGVFEEIREDSGRTITDLERMASLVRA